MSARVDPAEHLTWPGAMRLEARTLLRGFAGPWWRTPGDGVLFTGVVKWLLGAWLVVFVGPIVVALLPAIFAVRVVQRMLAAIPAVDVSASRRAWNAEAALAERVRRTIHYGRDNVEPARGCECWGCTAERRRRRTPVYRRRLAIGVPLVAGGLAATLVTALAELRLVEAVAAAVRAVMT